MIKRRPIRRFWLCSALAGLVAGCAAQSNSPRLYGSEILIRYAYVEGVSRVALPSAAPAGAVVGGFTGLVLSRRSSPGRQVASGVGGAVLGGLATRALEGERLGYSYRLRYLNGAESEFITEKGYLQLGDCVVVESGAYKNLRRVASAACNAGAASSTPRVPMHQANAEQCHQAKEQLLVAQGQDDVEDAARKVEIICQF